MANRARALLTSNLTARQVAEILSEEHDVTHEPTGRHPNVHIVKFAPSGANGVDRTIGVLTNNVVADQFKDLHRGHQTLLIANFKDGEKPLMRVLEAVGGYFCPAGETNGWFPVKALEPYVELTPESRADDVADQMLKAALAVMDTHLMSERAVEDVKTALLYPLRNAAFAVELQRINVDIRAPQASRPR
jgi:hypothetical protein